MMFLGLRVYLKIVTVISHDVLPCCPLFAALESRKNGCKTLVFAICSNNYILYYLGHKNFHLFLYFLNVFFLFHPSLEVAVQSGLVC